MGNEKEPVRVFLESYWEMRKDIVRLQDKIKDLEDLCYQATSQITGMPGGGGSGGSKGVWDALADTRSKALTTLRAAIRRCEEIEAFIAKVDDPVYRKVLQYRYISGYTMHRIAEELIYDERSIYRIRDSALEAAKLMWDELTNIKE